MTDLVVTALPTQKKMIYIILAQVIYGMPLSAPCARLWHALFLLHAAGRQVSWGIPPAGYGASCPPVAFMPMPKVRQRFWYSCSLECWRFGLHAEGISFPLPTLLDVRNHVCARVQVGSPFRT